MRFEWGDLILTRSRKLMVTLALVLSNAMSGLDGTMNGENVLHQALSLMD